MIQMTGKRSWKWRISDPYNLRVTSFLKNMDLRVEMEVGREGG